MLTNLNSVLAMVECFLVKSLPENYLKGSNTECSEFFNVWRGGSKGLVTAS